MPILQMGKMGLKEGLAQGHTGASTVLNALHVLTLLILMTVLGCRQYYFKDVETGIERLSDLCKVEPSGSEWSSQDSAARPV